MGCFPIIMGRGWQCLDSISSNLFVGSSRQRQRQSGFYSFPTPFKDYLVALPITVLVRLIILGQWEIVRNIHSNFQHEILKLANDLQESSSQKLLMHQWGAFLPLFKVYVSLLVPLLLTQWQHSFLGGCVNLFWAWELLSQLLLPFCFFGKLHIG